MNRRAARFLTLAACLLAGLRCGSSSTRSNGAPPPRPSGEAAAEVSAADEVAVFLESRLGLSPDQREKSRGAALALIERNAKLAEQGRTQNKRILESLRQSQARFDAEMLSLLTAEQSVKYLRLKQDFHQTVQGRPPFRGLSQRSPAGTTEAPTAPFTTPAPTVTPG